MKPNDQAVEALMNVASLLGQAKHRLMQHDADPDDLALVACAEGHCLHTLEQMNWGISGKREQAA